MRAPPRPVGWLLAALAAGACGTEDRPPTYGPPRDASPTTDATPDAGRDAAVEADAGDPPLPEPDIEFVLPFGGPPDEADIEYEALVRLLDLHLLVDTTGSMFEEIDEIQSELRNVAADVAAEVDDVTFGVSHFEDFPFEPFGAPDDRPFELLQDQGRSLDAAQSAVARLDDPLGNGGDVPESTAEALYQVATGEGFRLHGSELVAPYLPARGRRGGVGFREGALPVVLVSTDAQAHRPDDYARLFEGVHSLSEATEALASLAARVVGIASGRNARGTLVQAALATEATIPPEDGECPTGIDGAGVEPSGDVCPLVFDVRSDGSGLSDAIVGAIEALVESIVWRTVSIRILDDDLGFVTSAEALSAVPPDGSPPPGRADLDPVDGIDETFTNVYRGTRLTYRITVRNFRVEPADYGQIFYLRSQLVGDGETIVDEKLIRIVVPTSAASPSDGGPEAGPDGG